MPAHKIALLPNDVQATHLAAFVLTLLTLAALLAGCRSGAQMPLRNLSAVAGEEANRFCEAGDESQEWGCVDDQDLALNAPAAGPGDQSEGPRTDPGRSGARRTPTPRDAARPPHAPVPLTEVPPDYYVVQLVAVQTKETLEDYAARKELRGMSAARVERDGRLFYVLLLGVYPDREQASTAASSLPAEFADLNPWVRSVDSLQQAMRRADDLAGTTEI